MKKKAQHSFFYLKFEMSCPLDLYGGSSVYLLLVFLHYLSRNQREMVLYLMDIKKGSCLCLKSCFLMPFLIHTQLCSQSYGKGPNTMRLSLQAFRFLSIFLSYLTLHLFLLEKGRVVVLEKHTESSSSYKVSSIS